MALLLPKEKQLFRGRRRIVISWHRYFDPATGRYISADPIGLGGGMNLYVYVGGNPVNFIDPWGLMKDCPSTKKEASNKPSEWREYAPPGDWFHRYGEKRYHCGYKCYQEIQEEETCPENKQQECCYDENGMLAINDCRGTANSYDPRTDPIKHIFLDPGGIYHSGHAGEIESYNHACDDGASCSTSNNGTVW